MRKRLFPPSRWQSSLKTALSFLIGILLLFFPFFYESVLEYIVRDLPSSFLVLISTYRVVLDYTVFIGSGIFAALLFTRFLLRHRRISLWFTNILPFIVITYGIFLWILTMVRYLTFASQSIDVSYYHSVVWQLSEGKIPHIWDVPSRPVWSDHFEPVLLLFVPLYWVIKDASVLVALQAGFVISGVLPVLLVVRKQLGSVFLGWAVGCAYLLFGGLQMGYAYGFHPIVLFPPILFWLYYFFETKRVRYTFLFLFLALLVKEEVAFIVIFLGLYECFVKRRFFSGGGAIVLGVVWYILCFDVIFPFFNHGVGFGHWGQYGVVGVGGIWGVLKTAVVNPVAFLKILVTPNDKIDTFFHTFGAFSFLPFLYPPSLLLVIPSLLEKLLSSNIARLNGFHYSAAIAGVTVVASIEALDHILHAKKRNGFFTNTLFWTIVLLYSALFSNIMYGYPPLWPSSAASGGLVPKEHVRSLYRAIRMIPSGTAVAAQYQIAPHINRPFGNITSAPSGEGDATYVLLDYKLPLVLTSAQRYEDYLRKLLGDNQYMSLVNADGIVLFKRR